MKNSVLIIFVHIFLFNFTYAQPEDRYFNANSTRIRYVVNGTGEPVILIHGWASTVEQNWGVVMKDLAQDHMVIALDCRGHGKSDKPHAAKEYGVEMVKDIARLMDELKIKRVHIVGYSMGAMIALKFMAMYPARVSSAILAGQGGVREDTLAKTQDPMIQYLEKGMTFSEATMAALPAGEPRPSTQELMLLKFLDKNDSRALAAAMRGFDDLLVTNKQLKKNRIPTLALYSVEEKTVKPLQKLMPRVELSAIPNANHMTAPMTATFKKSIRDFLGRQAMK